MDNQTILNQAIKIDQQVFHNLLLAREYFEGLPFFKRQVKSLEIEVRTNLYRARQLALLENSKQAKKAYLKPFAWLVRKFTYGEGDVIGAIPFIPIAIVAAVAYVGSSWGNTYLSKKQEAQRDLNITKDLLTALAAETDPKVRAAIATRLNQKVAADGSPINTLVGAGIGIALLGFLAKMFNK